MRTVLAIALFFASTLCAAEHWAFRPIVRPEVPKVGTPGSSPVDAFIIAKLEHEGLKLSSAADRRTLLRRAAYTVTGLPPTADEVSRFQSGGTPFSDVVERLLASDAYGERWARHWLDVVRFAESHGFEMNQPRPNAWRYRDYVIGAFNKDLPYDRFVQEQIAGDVLGVPEATGFLVAGPWDQVKSPDPVLTANQRADELHDIVSTTASTFLGLTVGCARCHDHKFDPVPQKDYFAIKAVFEGVQHGEGELPKAAAEQAELDAIRREIDVVQNQIDESEPIATRAQSVPRAPVSPARNIERFEPVTVRRLKFSITRTTDAEPCIDELEVYSTSGENVALAKAGTVATASSVYPDSAIHRLEHINDGRYGNGRSWISNERGRGWVELTFSNRVTISRIVWARDRERAFKDRLATEYEILAADDGGELAVIASSADRADFKQGAGESDTPIDHPLLAKLRALEKKYAARKEGERVYAGSFTAMPPATRRFHRGDPMSPREEVSPGTLSCLEANFVAASHDAALTEDQRRRLSFARWVIDARNPLTARVMVNRIWQYHFGEGLVGTPSDFGAKGAAPTHPELLDWLADEFIRSGWSIKHVHRLILNSAVYQQASAPTKEGLQRDASARLLWRFPPRRLEAEAIRDSVLLISGTLDRRVGGPGFSFFEPNENYVRVYAPRSEWSSETFRRMVYGTVVRQRPDGVFGVFDCPDAGQIAPKRTRSTTPLQALNLLNSTFMFEQSQRFAAELQRSKSNLEGQLRLAFERAFQRTPTADELTAAHSLAEEHGLPIFCRALLNSNEFVYLF